MIGQGVFKQNDEVELDSNGLGKVGSGGRESKLDKLWTVLGQKSDAFSRSAYVQRKLHLKVDAGLEQLLFPRDALGSARICSM